MITCNKEVSQSSLLAAGVPGKYVRMFKGFDLDRSCSQFLLDRYDNDGTAHKVPVMPKKQAEWLTRCFEDPFHTEYTCYLSDYHNGDVARNAAVALISEAMARYNHRAGLQRPKWLRLDQSFDRQFDKESKYSFLVVDNVYVDSTSVKIEKLRDLLAVNDTTPTVVIVSSPGEPLALSHKFSLTATYGILLRNTRQVIAEESV